VWWIAFFISFSSLMIREAVEEGEIAWMGVAMAGMVPFSLFDDLVDLCVRSVVVMWFVT
jgi:hypothetical protein